MQDTEKSTRDSSAQPTASSSGEPSHHDSASPSAASSSGNNKPQSLEEQFECLGAELAELEAQCATCGATEEQIDQYIDQLHRYNEIKDVTQELLGRLAEIEGVTTRSLYPQYGLDVND